MTLDAFRRLALGLPDSTEGSHMGHPDFRVRGKIFATLCYPDGDWGMVRLTPEQQEAFVSAEPAVFARSLRVALAAAWRNVAPRQLVIQNRPSSADGP